MANRLFHTCHAIAMLLLVGLLWWVDAPIFLQNPVLGPAGSASIIFGQLLAATVFYPANRARVARASQLVRRLRVHA